MGQVSQRFVKKKDDSEDESIPNDLKIESFLSEKEHYNLSIIPLLISGYIRNENMPSSLEQLILSFYASTRDGVLIIESNKTITLQSDYEYEFESIMIHSNGILTVNKWDSPNKKGGTLLLNVMFNIIIYENGCINLNGAGYRGGYGYEPGESFNIDNNRFHSTDNNCGGGGGGYFSSAGNAGYGTKGMNGDQGKGGDVYGDETLTKLYLGSGGGGYDTDDYDPADSIFYHGGNGGGALKINCNQLIMNKNCYISCNGTNGGCKNHSGCGSGGSIHLIIQNKLMADKSAKIEAIGGQWSDKCIGGDGRIRFQLKKKNKQPNISIFKPIPFVG